MKLFMFQRICFLLRELTFTRQLYTIGNVQKIVILTDKCKGCGLCTEACPKKCLNMSDTFNKAGYHPAVFVGAEKCTSCGFCYQVCPDVCIEVYKYLVIL
ncbi:MAG: indolepyruvate ferredoxin oxidoreductase subunit alpha [Endomicrobiales bacterium]